MDKSLARVSTSNLICIAWLVLPRKVLLLLLCVLHHHLLLIKGLLVRHVLGPSSHWGSLHRSMPVDLALIAGWMRNMLLLLLLSMHGDWLAVLVLWKLLWIAYCLLELLRLAIALLLLLMIHPLKPGTFRSISRQSMSRIS